MAASPVKIPAGTAIVKVSVIDTKTFIGNLDVECAMTPKYPNFEKIGGPSYSFLINHAVSKSKLLFDLALRTDWEKAMKPEDVSDMRAMGWTVRVGADVSSVLSSHGVDLASIKEIIWSHHHWDHTGNPSLFPPSTSLLVGEGFKQEYLPGYPKDLKSEVLADAVDGREVREVDFSSGLKIGSFRAFDYFGDGSFYLLDTPGHTLGHLSGLARTTAGLAGEDSTFVFLGGDIIHYSGVIRPSRYLPVPDQISPSPYEMPFTKPHSTCPGDIFSSVHRLRNDSEGAHKSRTQPFGLLDGPEHDLTESRQSVDKLMGFDGRDDILTIFAHDASLMGVLEYFPELVNDWRAKGWRREGLWRFLADLVPPNRSS